MTKLVAYIGLGSNLENPEAQIIAARRCIKGRAGIQELAFSSLYRSAPMGPQDQPDYINAVMAINTDLTAIDLLRCLQKIELDQGRVRKEMRWGTRTLDLDILLYGQQIIDLPDLCVPHYGMAKRAFVLYPLHEIAPAIDVPGLGTIEKLLESCPLDGLEQIS